MADASLDDVAAELYAVAPTEFVSTRNERAKQSTDPALAKQIKALRKPSIAAWVMNLFATEHADRLGQALQLADQLRQAQEDLDANTLSKLGRDRRALTAQLAREAASLASTRGEQVTDSTLASVQQTITAAFFDADAAAAVASGRLLRELEPSSEFPLDFDTVVAGGAPKRKKMRTPPADEVRARREQKDAEKAVQTAERELDSATRDHEKADAEREAAASRSARMSAKVNELEGELEKARDDAKKSLAAVDDAAERAADAAERVKEAKRVVEEVREALASRCQGEPPPR